MAVPLPQESPVPAQENLPTTVTSNGDKGNKLLKFALIGLSVILVIILSEVGYLVFSGYGRTYFQITKPAPTPVSLIEEVNLPRVVINSDEARSFADKLDTFKIKEDFIRAATINWVIAGKVAKLSQGEAEDLGSLYLYQLVLTDSMGNTTRARFRKKEIETAKIYLVNGNNYTEIPYEQIRVGDRVTIKIVTNLLDNSPDSQLIFQVERN